MFKMRHGKIRQPPYYHQTARIHPPQSLHYEAQYPTWHCHRAIQRWSYVFDLAMIEYPKFDHERRAPAQ